MIAKRDLTDKTLEALRDRPVPTLRKLLDVDPEDSMPVRPIIWDAQVRGFGVRVSDQTPPSSLSFVLVTRYPGAKNPAPRTIGDYPSTPLAEARRIAREWRDDIVKGIDPKDRAEAARRDAEAAKREAERQQANTFRAAFATFAEEHLSTLRTGDVVKGVIDKHVLPVLGGRPLREITRAEAKGLLRTIARKTPTHANQILSYLRTFGDWAEDEEMIEESPFATLKRLSKESPRERVLSDDEVRAIWLACGDIAVFGRAFQFMLASAQRRSEVGNMEWRELDEGKKLWALPPERTKANRTHVVPLSPLAQSILAECPKIGEHVFATRSKRGKGGEGLGTRPVSGWSKAKTRLDTLALAELRRLTGDPEAELPEWHLHDFRRTAATRMRELGVDRLDVSKVLNHAESGVTKVYDQYAALPEKRRALELWGNRLSAIVERRGTPDADNVLQFERRG